MDTSRISFGEMVAAASGAALIFVMFVFDWFGYDGAEGGASAWQWMSFLDIVLFLCALIAIGLAVMRAAGEMPQLPAPPGQIVALVGALSVLIILFRLLVPGDGPLDEIVGLAGTEVDATRKIGAFLGLITAAGIAYGGYTALNERASGAAPGGNAAPPRPSTPPASQQPASQPPASEPPPSAPPPSEPPA